MTQYRAIASFRNAKNQRVLLATKVLYLGSDRVAAEAALEDPGVNHGVEVRKVQLAAIHGCPVVAYTSVETVP